MHLQLHTSAHMIIDKHLQKHLIRSLNKTFFFSCLVNKYLFIVHYYCCSFYLSFIILVFITTIKLYLIFILLYGFSTTSLACASMSIIEKATGCSLEPWGGALGAGGRGIAERGVGKGGVQK